MSYILDALKKAERERDIAQVPTLMTVHGSSEMPRRSPWIIFGICLACTLLLIIVAVSRLKLIGGHPPATTRQNDQEAKESSESHPAETQATPVGSTVTAESVIAGQTFPEAANAPAVNAPAKRTPENRPEVEGSRTSAPKQPQQQEIPSTAIQNSIQPQANVKSPASGSAGRTPAQDGAQPVPMSLHEALAKMTMTILLYSDVKSERMAFINDRKYAEGDFVDGRYLVESITPEGALLSYRDERVLLRPRAK